MSSQNSRNTTVGVSEQTHERLKELKPYDSVSFDEFINELADVWEADQDD